MIQINEQDIDKITEVFYSILKGKKPVSIELPQDYPIMKSVRPSVISTSSLLNIMKRPA